jgi:hypothetical protein
MEFMTVVIPVRRCRFAPDPVATLRSMARFTVSWDSDPGSART